MLERSRCWIPHQQTTRSSPRRGARTPRERMEHVVALNELCEQLSRAGVRARYPSADEDEVRLRVLALRLGRELMVEVYGWDPAARGW